MQKYLLLFGLLLSCTVWSSAQQDEHYTQFMYNKLWYNPAYAGSQGLPCFSFITRNQWLGLDGAPQAQSLAFDLPLLNSKSGVGGNIIRHSVAVTEEITLVGSYAYRFPLGPGVMGIGLSASVRYFQMNFSQTTATQQKEIDNAIPNDLQSKFLPNAGLGFYYHTDEFYAGFSMPRLLTNNIDLADDDGTISREVQHYYLMLGTVYGDESFKFLPQILLKYTPQAPFDADINMSFIIADQFTVGATYRLGGAKTSALGESIGILFSANVTEDFLVGISYDLTLTDLRDYQDGSVELALRFCIGEKSAGAKEYVNPRHF